MNERERVRLRAIVHGRVQGVGYRMYAVERARALGLDGYVRNLPDGRTVEVVAEGERPALESLLTALQRGPRLARVERVDTSWGTADGTLGAFDARH